MNGASRRRLAVLYLVVAALLAVLGVQAYRLQVENHAHYAALAQQDLVRSVVQPATRGQIVDDTGAPLVNNQGSMVISVNMSVLSRESDGGAGELHRLAGLLGIKDKTLRDKVRICTATVGQPCWPGSPYQPIPVALHVPNQVALQVLESRRRFPGVTAQVMPVTHYTPVVGTDTAQVLGYLQPATTREIKRLGVPVTGFAAEDLVGQSGLEGEYDKYLRGRPGINQVSVNANGQVGRTIRRIKPVNGDDLVTSINSKLQVAVSNILAGAIHKAQGQGAREGAAVVMTTTGRVVAMASYPTYNPSVWANGISEKEYKRLFGTARGEPILERATQAEYHPGSTWKLTTASAALAAGYPLHGLYDCPAAVNVNGHVFHNDFGNGGMMSLAQALIVSCDTVFYNFGWHLWQRDFAKYGDVAKGPKTHDYQMQKMELSWGFGRPTGVDLPGEGAGTVPTMEWLYYFWKDNAHKGQNWCKYGRQNGSYVQRIEWEDCHYGNIWEPGLAVDAAIGQGYVSVTPLELARAYAALANGGTLYAPRIGEELVSPSGKVVRRINPPVVGHVPLPSADLAYIRNALRGVVISGTAGGAFAGFPLNKVCVAGKTGTADVQGQQPTSVFVSFAPCAHPKLVVVVMIPYAGYGADVSAPAVRLIWDSIYGLEGHKALLPGGRLPGLPRLNPAQGRFVSAATAVSAGTADAVGSRNSGRRG